MSIHIPAERFRFSPRAKQAGAALHFHLAAFDPLHPAQEGIAANQHAPADA
jgi:hypothetical protein